MVLTEYEGFVARTSAVARTGLILYDIKRLIYLSIDALMAYSACADLLKSTRFRQHDSVRQVQI